MFKYQVTVRRMVATECVVDVEAADDQDALAEASKVIGVGRSAGERFFDENGEPVGESYAAVSVVSEAGEELLGEEDGPVALVENGDVDEG